MNLFATSRNPVECAQFLDDARVVNQCRGDELMPITATEG